MWKIFIVSIPQWFDYNLTMRKTEKVKQLGLNSTMVRLQHVSEGLVFSPVHVVSIPQWFDYNIKARLKTLLLFFVSIPQWFDYNNLFFHLCHQTDWLSQFHNGSIIPTNYHLFFLRMSGWPHFVRSQPFRIYSLIII